MHKLPLCQFEPIDRVSFAQGEDQFSVRPGGMTHLFADGTFATLSGGIARRWQIEAPKAEPARKGGDLIDAACGILIPGVFSKLTAVELKAAPILDSRADADACVR